MKIRSLNKQTILLSAFNIPETLFEIKQICRIRIGRPKLSYLFIAPLPSICYNIYSLSVPRKGIDIMLHYRFNPDEISLMEKRNGDDFEFVVNILNTDKHLNNFHQLRDHFNNNHIYTDVIFHARSDHEFRIIVRSDQYVDFIIYMLKYKLITQAEWQ